MFWSVPRKKVEMPKPEDALAGRTQVMSVAERHAVLGTRMDAPWPDGMDVVVVGLGCFWGAERLFWKVPGVYSTQVGYAAGFTKNPTYEEVCSGATGHNEVVRVVFDPTRVPLQVLLKTFWESHDPTTGMRQGNDVGTQYRSGIYFTTEAQRDAAEASRTAYETELVKAGVGRVTTEVVALGEFYFAEDYHQQYLHKNPNGYCGIGGTGVCLPS
jgi:peptide-methionine (S)-S-oxide reductase